MNYLSISKEDMCNGMGSRVVLWVSGCEHRCKNCRSKFSWNHDNGSLFNQETLDELCQELNKDYHKGLTLSGGDPLSIKNREPIANLLGYIKTLYPDKDVWCYTGYTWDEIKDLKCMEFIDVLVDGKYIEEMSNPSPKWCGSNNQRVIDVKKSLNLDKIVLYT